MNQLQKEAGDRILNPVRQKQQSYASQLPQRVLKRILEEEVE